MLVTIDDVKMFTTHTWGEVSASTWGAMLTTTWGATLLDTNEIILHTPTPKISHSVDKRSTASFSILDPLGSYHFDKGEEVEIWDEDGGKIFGGYIDSVTEELYKNNTALKHSISCVDYHYLADKRIVAKAWQNTTIETIVNWVLDSILETEGVTLGLIESAGPVNQYIANYVTASDVLDDMKNRAGFVWWIDEYKRLYFVNRGTYNADWDLEENANHILDDAISGLSVSNGNPEFRDKQYLLGATEYTDEQTEYSVGDGETTSFVVGYPIVEEPEVWVSINGAAYVEKTVGIKGKDTGKDWYWTSGDNTILQDSSATELTSADKIKIVYVGTYTIVAVSTDFAAILARQAVEGAESSGIVESVKSNTNVIGREAALEECNALLETYAIIGKKVTYTTTRYGLAVGVLQHILFSKHGLDDDVLIANMDISYQHGRNFYEITAYTGAIEESLEDIFLRMSIAQKKAANPDNISTSDVLLVLLTFVKNWTAIETPNIWQTVYADGTVLPGDAWFPCFVDTDRIKYLVLKNNGTELFRMYRTSQTSTANQIVATFIIPSGQANFEVDEAVLVGGSTATLTAGTGVEVETHSFPYLKSSLESLQLQFTSNKW